MTQREIQRGFKIEARKSEDWLNFVKTRGKGVRFGCIITYG